MGTFIAILGLFGILFFIARSARKRFSNLVVPIFLSIFSFPFASFFVGYLLVQQSPSGVEGSMAVVSFFYLALLLLALHKKNATSKKIITSVQLTPWLQLKAGLKKDWLQFTADIKKACMQYKADMHQIRLEAKEKQAKIETAKVITHPPSYYYASRLLNDDDDDCDDNFYAYQAFLASKQSSCNWIAPLAIGLIIGTSFSD